VGDGWCKGEKTVDPGRAAIYTKSGLEFLHLRILRRIEHEYDCRWQNRHSSTGTKAGRSAIYSKNVPTPSEQVWITSVGRSGVYRLVSVLSPSAPFVESTCCCYILGQAKAEKRHASESRVEFSLSLFSKKKGSPNHTEGSWKSRQNPFLDVQLLLPLRFESMGRQSY